MIKVNNIIKNTFDININFKKRYNKFNYETLTVYQRLNRIPFVKIAIFLTKTLQMRLNNLNFFNKIE